MSNPSQLQSARQNLNEWAPMKNTFSRREFVCSGACAAAAFVAMKDGFALGQQQPPAEISFPVRLGLASYTLRNFSRAQLIGFMKQLNVFALNAKDVKDHLPADPPGEAVALADYAAAGIKLHPAGVINFAKHEDADIRSKFEYSKSTEIPVIVAGDPTMQTLPRIEKFAKEYDIRIAIHNHVPKDKLCPPPLTILKPAQDMYT